MFLTDLLRSLFGTRTTRRPAKRRLRMETLEDRCVPAVVDVPFNVWTQNTQLRPNSLFTTSEHVALAAAVGATGIFSPIASHVAVAALAAEVIYNQEVDNTSRDNRQRTRQLLERIGGYDVVALQEVFDDDELDRVHEGASARNYSTHEGPDSTGFEQHSGLALLVRANSHLQVVDHTRGQAFEDDGPENEADAWSQKGFSLTRIQIGPDPDHFVYVVNTHTKADDTGKDHRGVRDEQIAQIDRYVDRYTDGVHPVIFMGDINVIAGSEEHVAMLATLGTPGSPALDVFADRPDALTSDPGRNAYEFYWNKNGEGTWPATRLDYVLVRQGSLYKIEFDADSRTLEDTHEMTLLAEEAIEEGDWDSGRTVYLSDHFGLSANLRFVRYVTFDASTGTLRVGDGSGDAVDSVTLDVANGNVLVGLTTGGRTTVGAFPASQVRSVVIQTGGGDDTIFVRSVPLWTTLSVEAGEGGDTITLGGGAGTLSTLAGQIRIDGQGGSDTVVFEDRANTIARTYTHNHVGSDNSLAFTGVFVSGAIRYAGIETSTLHAGNAGNTVNVRRTIHGGRMFVNTGNGNDTITVGDVGYLYWADAVTIDAQGGTNDRLTFVNDGDSQARTYTLHHDGYQTLRISGNGWNGQGYRYTNAETVTVNAGNAGNTVNVHRTIYGGRLFVNTGNGNDTIYVGDVGYLYWAGGLTIDAQGGGSDFLTFINRDDGTGRTYTVGRNATHDTLGISWGETWAYRNAEHAIIQAGTGNDVFRVLARQSANVTASGGIGGDTLDYSSYTSSQPVTVNLLAGGATDLGAAIGFENVTGGAGSDSLTGNALANVLIGGGGGDYLDGVGGSDRLDGGAGNDTYGFGVTTSGETDTIVEAADGGIDTLDFRNLTAAVTVNLSGTATALGSHAGRTLVVGAAGQAANLENVTGGAGSDSLTGNALANVLVGGAGSDSLTGGAGDDLYVFAPATVAETDTVIESTNGGIDTLDFSNLSTAVTVDLSGTTTALGSHAFRALVVGAAGQAANLENVSGGWGNDTFIGNNAANLFVGNAGNDVLSGRAGNDTLSGGTGRDLLFGGTGADTLTGGAGEDLLVGDGTFLDSQAALLQTMMAEWSSTRTFEQRMADLTGPGAGPRLNYSGSFPSVIDDNATDTMTGGVATFSDTERDWFFSLTDVVRGFDSLLDRIN